MSNRTTPEGYEIAKPVALVLMVMLFEYPLIEIVSNVGEWAMPAPLREVSVAIQAFAMGVVVSRFVAIWKRSEAA